MKHSLQTKSDPITRHRHCQENFLGVGNLFTFLQFCPDAAYSRIYFIVFVIATLIISLFVIDLLFNFYFSSFTLVSYLVSRDPSLSTGHPICCHIMTSNDPLAYGHLLALSTLSAFYPELPSVMSPLSCVTAFISVAD